MQKSASRSQQTGTAALSSRDRRSPLTVQIGDITQVNADAIVNAANSALAGGGGVDGAIHAVGGPAIFEECQVIIAQQGSCPTGTAVATSGGSLPARWVIHTVGPIWSQHDPLENRNLLASCYGASLDLAAKLGAKTVAFSAISTGVYGYPRELAAPVAVSTVRDWLTKNGSTVSVEAVSLVCFDQESFDLCQHALDNDS